MLYVLTNLVECWPGGTRQRNFWKKK
jgi:hypothetical protein